MIGSIKIILLWSYEPGPDASSANLLTFTFIVFSLPPLWYLCSDRAVLLSLFVFLNRRVWSGYEKAGQGVTVGNKQNGRHNFLVNENSVGSISQFREKSCAGWRYKIRQEEEEKHKSHIHAQAKTFNMCCQYTCTLVCLHAEKW